MSSSVLEDYVLEGENDLPDKLIAEENSEELFTENKTEIEDGIHLSYIRPRTECEGTHNILCIPGALGCWEFDYKKTVEEFDPLDYTVTAVDPPGYGKSRPPERTHGKGDNERDAHLFYKLMKGLDSTPFTVVGHSDGGVTALLMAHLYPDDVKAVVLWGTNVYVTKLRLRQLDMLRNMDVWLRPNRDMLTNLYGAEYLETLWHSLIDERHRCYNEDRGLRCPEVFEAVKQKTLILHGERDSSCPFEQPYYIVNRLQNGRFLLCKGAGHNLHVTHFKWFHKEIDEFLKKDCRLID